MQLGIVGLGRMGANMARRLRHADIPVVAYNRNPAVAEALAEDTGAVPASGLEELVRLLSTPRITWLMLPAGEITNHHITQLSDLLAPGDVIVDGANGFYRDAIEHAERLAAKGIHFVDAGVSGGVWGLANGYCLMLGGAPESVRLTEPVIKVLAPGPETGWIHCGPAGSGHFVKMIHNGIEYGMMQALAEGFALMEAKKDFDLDLGAIAETWRHGSVVRSWLLDLTADFLGKDQALVDIEPLVADSGEGRWTVQEAVELGLPAPVITLALMARFASQGKADYGSRLLAMMRQGFGGHAVKQERK
jgi:6-phosphogluconate dehydrogenase